MKKAVTMLRKMRTEAENIANPPETRENCRECAEWIETIILSAKAPKLRRVPFSWFYEAICGQCNGVLQTDTGDCPYCGNKIDWSKL